jgi:hypothetical protein
MTHEISVSGAPRAAALDATKWLSLAAAPTFAIMALLTGVLGGPSDMLCAMMQGTSPLSGMTLMYLLMSAFHAGPWLRLIFATSGDTVGGHSGGIARPFAGGRRAIHIPPHACERTP